MLGLDPPIVRPHDLRLGELRAELVEQHRGGHAADGELRGLVEKAAAVEPAVDVGVEQDQQFLVEIVGGLAIHGASPFEGRTRIPANAARGQADSNGSTRPPLVPAALERSGRPGGRARNLEQARAVYFGQSEHPYLDEDRPMPWTVARLAVRRLLQAPLFTAVTLITLAVGIGANTAIFSIVYGVLLKPLPFTEPERLVGVWHKAPGMGFENLNQSPATYFTYREHSRTFQDIGIYRQRLRLDHGPGRARTPARAAA